MKALVFLYGSCDEADLLELLESLSTFLSPEERRAVSERRAEVEALEEQLLELLDSFDADAPEDPPDSESESDMDL